MTSYTFSNRNSSINIIEKFIESNYSLMKIDKDEDSVSLGNESLYIVIEKNQTTISLLQDDINIGILRKYFLEKMNEQTY